MKWWQEVMLIVVFTNWACDALFQIGKTLSWLALVAR